jgi:uncharacterized protein (DUF1800 family)
MEKGLLRFQFVFGILFLAVYPSSNLDSQDYQDYIGAGHFEGISVTTSSNAFNTTGWNTIDGSGLDARKMEAARFFSQASFGASLQEIETMSADLDFGAWLDAQFALPPSLLLPKLWEIDQAAREYHALERPGDEYFGPWAVHFNYAWTDQVQKSTDQLRQRVAFALSQIFVISMQSGLSDFGEGLASYYDVLVGNAFGNYKDLMMDVAVHPCMGFYLSHLNNPKTDEVNNIHPDENFAREIMQLFSIGLYELNLDGTRKIQGGEWIPTYDNNDIKELAKVFTGLGMGAWAPWIIEEYGNVPLSFGENLYAIDRTVPMSMFEEHHEQGAKTIIGGHTIPAGLSGMEDIERAVEHLFMHPNVGPFVSQHLIQRMVTSNPTPSYVERIATVFNDNGQGVRGDMKSVIRAILMDEEARGCGSQLEGDHGKLREPMLRFAHVMKSLMTDSPSGHYWNNTYDYYDDTRQSPLNAPSVFNFYLPDHQPVGQFASEGLFAPEFQILNSQTSIGYLNQVNKWVVWNVLFWDWIGRTPEPEELDLTPHVEVVVDNLIPLAEDPEALINRLDILFTHGQLSEGTRGIIRDAITPFNWEDSEIWRVRMALYLILISPDYVVFK